MGKGWRGRSGEGRGRGRSARPRDQTGTTRRRLVAYKPQGLQQIGEEEGRGRDSWGGGNKKREGSNSAFVFVSVNVPQCPVVGLSYGGQAGAGRRAKAAIGARLPAPAAAGAPEPHLTAHLCAFTNSVKGPRFTRRPQQDRAGRWGQRGGEERPILKRFGERGGFYTTAISSSPPQRWVGNQGTEGKGRAEQGRE